MHLGGEGLKTKNAPRCYGRLKHRKIMIFLFSPLEICVGISSNNIEPLTHLKNPLTKDDILISFT